MSKKLKKNQRNLRSKRLRNLLLIAYDGRCAICGDVLPENWHADHITPWKETQRTNLFEMQPTCPECNLKKGAK